jgi:competence protein ComEA
MKKLLTAAALVLLAQLSCTTAAFAVVNINTATTDELVALKKGLGPAKAQAIVDYRKANGPFKSVDDLKHVKGIGNKRLEKLRPELTVGGSGSKVAAAGSTKADAKAASPAMAKGDIKPVTDTVRK